MSDTLATVANYFDGIARLRMGPKKERMVQYAATVRAADTLLARCERAMSMDRRVEVPGILADIRAIRGGGQ